MAPNEVPHFPGYNDPPTASQDEGAAARSALYDKPARPVRPGEFYLRPTDLFLDQQAPTLFATLGLSETQVQAMKDQLYAMEKQTNLPSNVTTRIAQLMVDDSLRAAPGTTAESCASRTMPIAARVIWPRSG